MHTAHSTQHTAHSTQHTAHSTQHTAHSTQPDYSHLGLFVKDFARDPSAFLGGRVPFCVDINIISKDILLWN